MFTAKYISHTSNVPLTHNAEWRHCIGVVSSAACIGLQSGQNIRAWYHCSSWPQYHTVCFSLLFDWMFPSWFYARLKASRIFLNESVIVLCQVLITRKVIDLIWQIPIAVEMQPFATPSFLLCLLFKLWYTQKERQAMSHSRFNEPFKGILVIQIFSSSVHRSWENTAEVKKNKKKQSMILALSEVKPSLASPETLHLQGWVCLLYTRCHQNIDCCLRHIRGGASSVCPAEGTLLLHQDMTAPLYKKNTRTRVRVVLMF